jgi:hypothetical protein
MGAMLILLRAPPTSSLLSSLLEGIKYFLSNKIKLLTTVICIYFTLLLSIYPVCVWIVKVRGLISDAFMPQIWREYRGDQQGYLQHNCGEVYNLKFAV